MQRTPEIHIYAQTQEECMHISSFLENSVYNTREYLFRDDIFTGQSKENAEVNLIVLPEDFDAQMFQKNSRKHFLPERSIYITTSCDIETRRLLFQQGASDILVKPFSASELILHIERLTQKQSGVMVKEFDESQQIRFLRGLIEKRQMEIKPALDAMRPSGYFYPSLLEKYGKGGSDSRLLDKLATEGLLDRHIVNKIRLCPDCDSAHLNYRELCPKCLSIDINQEEIIHHFACGKIETLAGYKHGDKLICPKCEKELRHIGLDYEKTTQKFSCGECSYIFADPMVGAQCLSCGRDVAPDETIERIIYKYAITPLAEEAVASGQIVGTNLDVLLKNKRSGLYSKHFFIHEIEREMLRFKRYSDTFCLMLIRIEHLADLKKKHPRKVDEYVQNVFQALSADLRPLDITCVWDANTLGVLLPNTNEEGSFIVASRMNESLQSKQHLFSIQRPEIAIGLVLAKDETDGVESLLKEAITELEKA